MKTNMIVTCATTLFCACAIVQVDADDRAYGNRGLPEILEEYDLDKDGVYSEEERDAVRDTRRECHQRRLDRWDTDGDGILSEEEREEAKKTRRQRMEEKRTDRFEEADIDEDGLLSFEEFSALPAVERLNENHPDKPGWIFNNLDGDGDGLVNLEEFVSHPPFHRRPGQGPGKAQDSRQRGRGR